MTLRAGCYLLCGTLIAVVGCGQAEKRPDRVPVSGRVTIDGKPLEYGTVQVIPTGDRPASGKIGADGRFELMTYDPGDGCVLGQHRVAVIANESIDAGQRWHAPKKYIDPEQSGLSINITGPTSDLVIELTWDGQEPFVERFETE